MTQMWLLWWPKHTSSAAAKRQGGAATAATTSAAVTATSCSSFSSSSHCPCLTKMVRKLKKQARTIGLAPSRQASFEYRYDPLSYSLNFDDSSAGCGNMSLLDEDNYYQFCAFSSRFVANPRTSSRLGTDSAH